MVQCNPNVGSIFPCFQIIQIYQRKLARMAISMNKSGGGPLEDKGSRSRKESAARGGSNRRKQEVKLKHQQNRGRSRQYKDQRSFQSHQTKNSRFPDARKGGIYCGFVREEAVVRKRTKVHPLEFQSSVSSVSLLDIRKIFFRCQVCLPLDTYFRARMISLMGDRYVVDGGENDAGVDDIVHV